jgi:hypothetical protein
MNIYIAMIVDRHTDPFAMAFREFDDAVNWVKDCLTDEEFRYEDDEPMTEDELFEMGWCYHKKYSCEDDYVYIEISELK